MSSKAVSIELILALSSLNHHWMKKVDSQLSIHGISFTELLVLHQLDQSAVKAMKRIDLAEAIGLTASGVTRLLNPMEKLGWVEKDSNPRDARVSLIKLTEAGDKAYQDAYLSFSHCAESLAKNINEKQQIALIQQLNQLK